MLLTTTEVAASTAATTATATAVITTTAATATEVAARAIEASTTAAATTACRTVFARTGFVDCKGTAIEIFAVELLNSCLSLGIGCHRDEGESAGAASEFILH